jgi:hypothetical protein
MKRTATLIVVLFAAIALAPSARADLVTVVDNSTSNLTNNHMQQEYPDSVANSLLVACPSYSYQRTSVLKYDQLPDIDAGEVVSARLGLNLKTLYSPNSYDLGVLVRAAKQSWDGSTLTWNNAPFGSDKKEYGVNYDWENLDTTTVTDTQDAWFWWDVTPAVVGWLNGSLANNGLLIVPKFQDSVTNKTTYQFGAAGNGDIAPQLEITYTPEPATMGLLSIGGLALLRRKRN